MMTIQHSIGMKPSMYFILGSNWVGLGWVRPNFRGVGYKNQRGWVHPSKEYSLDIRVSPVHAK